MADGRLALVLRELRTLSAAQAAEGRADAELLEHFAARRDEAAFAALLRRHAGIVFGVCRRVLADDHAAEDAFQATFLLLARKAAAIRERGSVVGWLHAVAYHVALKAKAAADRRREHERRAGTMRANRTGAGPARPDVEPILDEELHRLPAAYQKPILLCYLEGKTHAEAARELGWPVGTVKGRLARGRELLRRRLARRGLQFSAAGLTAALSEAGLSATVPPGLLAAALGTATGAAAARVLALAESAAASLAASKLTLGAVFVVLAGLMAGGVGLWRASAGGPAEPPRAEQPKPEPAAKHQTSAPALMQSVYDGFTWVDSARTFHIRTDYKITHTEKERRWQEKHPQRAWYGDKPDFRPFRLQIAWAWDDKRIFYRTQSHYEGESNFNRQTRIWDGSLALEHGESADKKRNHYVLGNKAADFFAHTVTPMELPWMLYGAHKVWWMPTGAVKERDAHGVAPADFELEGQEVASGRPCHVLLSRVGGYRMHVGVADGRLYRRTWLLVSPGRPGYDRLALLRKVGGPSIKTVYHWEPWLASLDADRRRRAWRDLKTTEFEFTHPVFYQTFDDYRQVAPGCWLPFRQTVDSYNLQVPEPFVSSHSEQTVTEVTVNRPLGDELFRIKLTDDVPVTTDWRYDPPIRYTYRKDQPEAERVALAETEKKKRAQAAEEMDRRRAVIKSRMGAAPPALPRSGWLNGGPLSWEQLRGKVVVIHFWDLNCGPCQNELPFLARWHEDGGGGGIAVIGVHPPTKDVAAVRKKLDEFGAKYPVVIDAPIPNRNGGVLHDWFGNTWWPHTVLVNKRGLVAGEGQVWMGDAAAQMRRLAAEKD